MEAKGIALWAVLVANGILWVSLDLLTTAVGLSRGFMESNPYGNMPILYYLWSISTVTIIYLILPFRLVKINNKALHLTHSASMLFVSCLPVTAVIYNLFVLGYL